jgi:hypothetical protein
MPTYRIWERGVYAAREVEAHNMREAVRQFAGVEILHLHGMVNLSTKSNPVEWIDANGDARQFTAYEVNESC